MYVCMYVYVYVYRAGQIAGDAEAAMQHQRIKKN
jgi:hypothetical protein